ncbi:HAD family hydrolase [Vibrio salinus]|uniref:HAD family hydrolase n=1 Tax=Vibrio salinus TaxID=2899784 RepID=UPI001E656681|nr:HAD family hydrolase [Vibrio salinus]MCE0494777.1 HAD family hydrolase [Vibrio salinus]
MTKVYLFDWGDTLMVDFPDLPGKMCDWVNVEMVEGAESVLSQLSANARIFIATNAAESSEDDIRKAFERVGLAQYITGYFCKANLGIGKGSPEFFYKIAEILGVPAESITMVGDSIKNDIEPALKAGVAAVWFNSRQHTPEISTTGYRQIHCLHELCLRD